MDRNQRFSPYSHWPPSTASVFAGPVADFENALQGAYADYRAALFMTNIGKIDGIVQGCCKHVGQMGRHYKDVGADAATAICR